MNKLKNEYFFYCLILILFALDIFSFSFFEKQIIDFLVCFYFLALYYEQNLIGLFIVGFLISVESSLHYGLFGTQLLYLIPCTILGFYAQKMLNASYLHPYIFLISSLIMQSYWIEPYFLKIQAVNSYTNLKIIANIIVMIGISLISFTQGKQGNRWKALLSFLEESPDSQ